MVYDPNQDSYDTLPPYTYKFFSMAIVNNQLVLVGGRDAWTNKLTNQLGIWNEQSNRWTHPLPPMTTACNSPSVATHNNRWLVVMGGGGGSDTITYLSRVEILDTNSAQWYHAASLPRPMYDLLPAIIRSLSPSPPPMYTFSLNTTTLGYPNIPKGQSFPLLHFCFSGRFISDSGVCKIQFLH